MKYKTPVIIGVIVLSLTFFILVGLAILQWIKIVHLIIVIVSTLFLFGIVVGIGVLIHVLNTRKNPARKSIRIKDEDFIDYGRKYIMEKYYDLIEVQHYRIWHLGEERTPIGWLHGTGRITKHVLDLLINLYEPEEKISLLINSDYTEVKETAELLTANPPKHNVIVQKTTNPNTGEVTEKKETILVQDKVEEEREEL